MNQFSVEVGPEKPANATRIRRNILSPDEFTTHPHPDIKTLGDLLPYLVKNRANRNALGYRAVEDIIEEEKVITKVIGGQERKETKTWKYFKLGPYQWYTYADVTRISREIGCGLLKLGLNNGDKLTIFSRTSPEWIMMSQACFSQSLTIVTAYETLGADGLKHALNEGEISVVFTTAELLKVIVEIMADVPSLKHVIYMDKAKNAVIDSLSSNPQLSVHTYEEVRALGAENLVEASLPSPEDLACIMYTSGSTGNPKGVMLSHANVVAGIAGIDKFIRPFLDPDTDVLITYLPLAHILEFLVENYAMFLGIPMGYASPRTLTDTSVRQCKGDLRELRPTVMCGVPAVWETIRKGVMSQVEGSGRITQILFDLALRNKSFLNSYGIPTSILDTIVFNKIKEATGGRLRFALSGGAPIAPATSEFLTTCICPIIQGYGMTEATAMATFMNPDVKTSQSNGPPVPCCEIKLVDVEETNYRSTNDPPQGEVWVRGPAIMKGYFKNTELTKEVITEDGWLMTGDIGQWLPDGTLGIIDRKKNLVKLSNGEYIALEKLESLYKTSYYADQVCVYADSYKNRPVAIIVCSESKLRDLAQQQGVTEAGSMGRKELADSDQVRKAILQDMNSIAKKNKFVSAEMLHDVFISDEDWTSDNGLLTAAQKLKRREIVDRYKEKIEALY
ncbi:acetyl-CoA synthetase-like protein [Basidiobolus meristosporus CBS 931.73]|uniref:Acetyl-CoA synthetase-like protein n=1 Tax=Basidiobolus meristosporus CBS 931.73 TaxID=1314790 RepID=A0A1Y1YHX4_9FUNG|nr:acetyl-CoA synthetase-like protein [Basidiobolus meristosporus CBS 931.73]|eukprot:ORX97316.1 acetyl-CoA synthetase-like protein [Basidiobolus meristosporus CBS 931.73]